MLDASSKSAVSGALQFGSGLESYEGLQLTFYPKHCNVQTSLQGKDCQHHLSSLHMASTTECGAMIIGAI
jgi:hypothetical protein